MNIDFEYLLVMRFVEISFPTKQISNFILRILSNMLTNNFKISQAEDNGTIHQKSEVLNIIVNICDVNDEPPVFTYPLKTIYINENAEVGTLVDRDLCIKLGKIFAIFKKRTKFLINAQICPALEKNGFLQN